MSIPHNYTSPALAEITRYYGGTSANRSKVPLINHIDEGIVILQSLDADSNTIDAFCIHPLIQADSSLPSFCRTTGAVWDFRVILYAMHYREVANSYLLHSKPSGRLPILLPEVRQMLIADKVQNYKDFLYFHAKTHEYAAGLTSYFESWLSILDVGITEYRRLTSLIS